MSGHTGEGSLDVIRPDPDGDDLDLRLTRVRGSIVGKQLIARKLINGQLTFQEAIERVRALSVHNPNFPWSPFRANYPGATDDERIGRHIIASVESELRETADQARDLVSRLEVQLNGSPSEGALPPAR